MAGTPGSTDWTVTEYEQAPGRAPLVAFLGGLEGRNANDAAALLALLKEQGNQLRPPRSKKVEDNLFELRGHQVRMFYMFLPGRVIVMLDGIVKKQDEIPRQDLERIRHYRQEVLRRGPRAARR
jgi:hypothetical protein